MARARWPWPAPPRRPRLHGALRSARPRPQHSLARQVHRVAPNAVAQLRAGTAEHWLRVTDVEGAPERPRAPVCCSASLGAGTQPRRGSGMLAGPYPGWPTTARRHPTGRAAARAAASPARATCRAAAPRASPAPPRAARRPPAATGSDGRRTAAARARSPGRRPGSAPPPAPGRRRHATDRPRAGGQTTRVARRGEPGLLGSAADASDPPRR